MPVTSKSFVSLAVLAGLLVALPSVHAETMTFDDLAKGSPGDVDEAYWNTMMKKAKNMPAFSKVDTNKDGKVTSNEWDIYVEASPDKPTMN